MAVKTLLIRPPDRYKVVPACDIPLGLMYLGSSLRAAGFPVEIYDALAEPGSHRPTSKTDAVQPAQRTWKSCWQAGGVGGCPPDAVQPAQRTRKYCRQAGGVGGCPPDAGQLAQKTWKSLEEKIQREKPDVVGITNRFSAQLESPIAVAELVKGIDRNILTVVGGNHASVSPNTFFETTEAIDIACQGEGESTILDIVRFLQEEKPLEDIEGITFRKDGRVVSNKARDFRKELDELPFPAYDLVKLEAYFSAVKRGLSGRSQFRYPGSERAISMITSRGCPYNCSFCSIHLHMGYRWRSHSAEYVLAHLEHVVKNYGVRHVHFEDDNLTLNMPRFSAILDGMINKRLGITWDTPNGVRADILTKDLLRQCVKAGCAYLFIGVESGVQRVLDEVVKKKLDLEAVRKVAGWCKEVGLNLGAFYVIGFPGESQEEMRETLRFALDMEREFGVWPVTLIATPLIGTELHQVCLENGYLARPLTPLNLSRALDGEGIVKTPDFTPEGIAALRDGFYKSHKWHMVANFGGFLLRHPKAWPRFLGNVFGASSGHVKGEILNNMFLTHCLLR